MAPGLYQPLSTEKPSAFPNSSLPRRRVTTPKHSIRPVVRTAWSRYRREHMKGTEWLAGGSTHEVGASAHPAALKQFRLEGPQQPSVHHLGEFSLIPVRLLRASFYHILTVFLLLLQSDSQCALDARASY